MIEGPSQSINTSTSQLALSVGLGLGQADDFAAVFPLAALFEQLDSLEALQDVALGDDGAGSFYAAVLRHKIRNERPK